MKVAYFYTGNRFGGVEKLLLNLYGYRALAAGIEPIFILCFAGKLSAGLRAGGAVVEIIPAPSVNEPLDNPATFDALEATLREYGVEVIVSHEVWNHAIAWPVARRLGIRNVLWIHSSTFDRHYADLYRQLDQWPPDMIIGTSMFVQGLIHARWPSIGTEYLYPPYGPPKLPARAPWDGEVRFIHIGRMAPYKGLAEMIEALSVVRPRSFTLTVVGEAQSSQENDYLARVVARCRTLGIADRVRFAGFQDNVFDFFLSADVFVHPNTEPEPLGLVFVEALFAGCPIVATDMGGAKEILDAQPCKMGDLVPPNDVSALAMVLTSYIEDAAYRNQISHTIRTNLVNILDPVSSMAKLSRLLNEIR